jgi:transposase
MARRRTMTEKRDVIRRLQSGQSIRQINKETGMHRTIIRDIRDVAAKNKWLCSGAKLPTEKHIRRCIERAKNKPAEKPHPLDRFNKDIKEYLKKKYTYLVIHQLISAEYPCSEATVRRYCQRKFPHLKHAVMLRETVPGEVMEVDFGYLGLTYDPKTKRNRKTYLFSARLRHSRYAYREVVFNQKQRTFFQCHIHAFEYFGGVPEKVVPDNLKAAVVKASFEDPTINRVYHRLAIHYGFLVSPCLPGKPEHKGGVENDIKYVKNSFWPLFKERERQRGHETPCAEDLQSELDRWSADVAHVRTVKGVGRRPVDMFTEEEQATLKPLPASRWDQVDWAVHTVQETWRIQFDRSFYSVPYHYIGKKVLVYANSSTVEIYLGEQEITRHRRAERDWMYVRNPLHAPPEPELYLYETKERVIEQAEKIGSSVATVVREILGTKGVDGMRPARALLSLAKKYGHNRLRKACKRAMYYDTPEYQTVKRILVQNLDREELEDPIDMQQNYCFTFARSPEFFLPESYLQQEVQSWTN